MKIPASIVALAAVVLLVVLGWSVLRGNINEDYRLPVIAVFAIAAMFAMIAFVAAIYESASISAPTQALGLPEGSVRALIALSLIVIFAVITLFMLSRLTSTQEISKELVAALAKAQAPCCNGGATSSTPNGTVASQPATATGGAAPAQTQTSGGTQSSPASEAVATIRARQDAAQDLAKQLLTMLGTLLAAVSAFYFGSSGTIAAMNAKPGGGAPPPVAALAVPAPPTPPPPPAVAAPPAPPGGAAAATVGAAGARG